MASDSDIFGKMDALLRKHHPGALDLAAAAGDEPPAVAAEGETAVGGADIPTLTEIVDTPPTDIPAVEDPFPVLTEVVDVAEPPSSPLELDFDFDEGAYFPAEAATGDEDVPGEAPDTILEPAMQAPPEREGGPGFGGAEPVLPAGPAAFDAGVYSPAGAVAADAPTLPEALDRVPEPAMEAPPEREDGPDLGVAAPVAPATPAVAVVNEDSPAAVAADHAPLAAAERPAVHALSGEDFGRISDSLTEQVLRNLDRRLQQMLEDSLAPRLADSLDRTLSGMLDQFAINIQQMVRESVAEELQKRQDAPPGAGGEHSKPGGDPV